MSLFGERPFWISVEGTDAVGKSRVLKELKPIMDSLFGVDHYMTHEFSNSPIGLLIGGIISKKKFFSLGDNFNLPLSETLLLCTDFVYQIEKSLKEKKYSLLITERGPHSFLSYQMDRMVADYGNINSVAIKNWISGLFAPVGFPNYVILLTSTQEQIKDRCIARDTPLDDQGLKFVNEIQKQFLQILKNGDIPFKVIKNCGQFERTLFAVKKTIIDIWRQNEKLYAGNNLAEIAG